MGLLLRWPPHRRWWVVVPQSNFAAWYVCRETRIVTYPTKGGTLVVQAPRKASTEAPKLSKDKIGFNLSLNISIYVSTTIGSQLLSAPDPEQSNSLRRTPVRRVWAEEAMWHCSSMEVVGPG
jgi:hypothetical protein